MANVAGGVVSTVEGGTDEVVDVGVSVVDVLGATVVEVVEVVDVVDVVVPVGGDPGCSSGGGGSVVVGAVG